MSLVIVRCDASERIGSGHVMRCRTLARALQRRGAEIVFFCRRWPGDLTELLEQEFKVFVLPAFGDCVSDPCGVSAMQGRELYASWLGCSEAQDADDCLALIDPIQLQPNSWLVVDHYGLGATWQQLMQDGLRQKGVTDPSVLVLDDLADRNHHAAVLMDANRLDEAGALLYRERVPKSCTTLLGPAFALLDPLYPQLQPLLSVRKKLSRVLVFFGGMDVSNLVVALQALSHPRLLHLLVDVVVGEGMENRADLEALVLRRPHTSLYVGLPSLAGLMAQADLALGAAGTASWERACLGLPCLVVPVAENQTQGARALQCAGVARCLDLKAAADPVADLQAELLDLLDSPASLQSMSEACLQLGDGRGLARVVAAMFGPDAELHLRPAHFADLWLYHWWASDPEVRRQSFNSEPISLMDHRCWFVGRLKSPLALLRVMTDPNGLPLGQIRFERSSETETRAVISFSLDRLARGYGLASRLLQLGLVELARCWGDSCEVYGEVWSENSASCRAFQSAGFQEQVSPRPGVRCFNRLIRSAL